MANSKSPSASTVWEIWACGYCFLKYSRTPVKRISFHSSLLVEILNRLYKRYLLHNNYYQIILLTYYKQIFIILFSLMMHF